MIAPFFRIKDSRATLLRVGPFADQKATPLASLSDITYSASQVVNTTRTSPLKYKNITVNAGVTLSAPPGGNWCIFIWCDQLTLNGTIDVSGLTSLGAVDGAEGASGGGGGAGSDEENYFGGDGGSGGNGGNGQPYPSDGIYGSPGLGGSGTGTTYNTGYTYGNGGNGTRAITTDGITQGGGLAGAGGNGYGGGGAGTDTGAGSATVGGSSGAGLIVIVARVIVFGASGTLKANGGDRFEGTMFSGAGGGGVIWVAAQKKQTSPSSATVTGGFWYQDQGSFLDIYADPGTAVLKEIEANLSLTDHGSTFTDTWDNT